MPGDICITMDELPTTKNRKSRAMKRNKITHYSATAALVMAAITVCTTVGCKKEETKADTQVAAIPPEFTKEALKNMPPDQAFENFRKAMDRVDLTEEQKEQIRDNGREIMEQRMDERIDEYFNAPESEKKKVLDKSIDEFEKMRKEREARDAEREKMSEEEKEKDRQKWRDRMRGRDGGKTTAERKTRTESRSADKMGKRMAYFTAVANRMKERGMEPPNRGPFGGGGRGRGPGG